MATSPDANPPFSFVPIVASGLLARVLAVTFSLRDVLRMREWIEVPCVVVTSQARRTESGRFCPGIVHRFILEGREYESSHYSVVGRNSSQYTEIAPLIDLYPPGRRTVCYVDPLDPTKSVLTREIPWFTWLPLVPALSFVATTALLLWQLSR